MRQPRVRQPHMRTRVQVWSALRRQVMPVAVTVAVVVAFAALLVSFDVSGGGLTVRLFPSASGGAGSSTTLSTTSTPTDTPTDTPSPTPVPTATDTPAPPTATPVPPVIAATFTCAHAQSGGPTQDPGTYFGELCVHTVADAPITVSVSFCGVTGAQGISGMHTDANGNWSLADTPTATNPWSFKASCALPFTVSLSVYGTAPNGDAIAGSASFTVSQ